MMDAIHPFQSWIDPRVEGRPSPIGGLGTFARAPIAAGEPGFRRGGVRFTPAAIRAGAARPGTVAAVDEDLSLAAPADAEADPSDFANRTCDPTLWMAEAVTLVARRDIAAGEELTGDDATWEAGGDHVAAWPCRCGSPLGRGRLTGRDWRRPELRVRYGGHFSPFLNRRIAALAESEGRAGNRRAS